MRPSTARFLVAQAAVLGFAILSSACLVKETSSTIYVGADGSATWTILETNVHSDATDGAAAAGEEAEYVAGHAGRWSPLALALSTIGGLDTTSQLLREQAPFETHASARFASLAGLFQGYCAAAGFAGCESRVEISGSKTTWTWTLAELENTDRSAVEALDEALSELRVVLRSGRFVSSRGFTIVEPTIARIAVDEDEGNTGVQNEAVLSLTWDGACSRTRLKLVPTVDPWPGCH